ncbi:zf-CCHC domain-containing protein [Tanacetum coccineum]
MHQTSIARTPQQNGVVERRNRTLVDAARIMLIFSKSLEFLWAEAISTACFTQNRSLVHTRYNKTPYEMIKGRKPNVQYFHVFGSLCYPTNDRDDLGKMKPKAGIDKYLEGQSMQRPPLFKSDCFIYWKNRFETYVKVKDLDLWHIILNGDFPPVAKNKVTQVLEVVPFEEQSNDLKKKLAKNNEAKMVLYNALPKKEYERVFMCKPAKDIWQSLLITHQGNSQVKNNKINLLVQQYEQFTILEEESINSGFAGFNTIITGLKALDEGFSSKNYVRKFFRALHPKWRAKVKAIEESKDLSSLTLDELIGNLKVHEVIMEKDSEIYRGKKKRVKSIAFKAKKECGDPNHRIDDCPKPPRNKDIKAFIGGSWSDSENDVEDKTNDETCLMAQSSNEVTLNSSYYSDNASSLDNDSMQLEYDNLCEISLKIINKNKVLKTKRNLLEKEILELNEKIKKLERNKDIDITCKSCQELKLENARLKETQVKFVKFDKSANSLREMLNNQKSSSCKIGLGFDSSKVSTSGTKPINFVGSSIGIALDGSTIPGSVDPLSSKKVAEHIFSPPMSSRSDFVITRKKLIHNKIEESNKPSLKPSLKSGLSYVKIESRSKTPLPRRNNFLQPRHNTPQPRRNSREPIHQNFYPMNWNNNQSQGFVHIGNCIPFQYPNQLQQLQGMYNTNVFRPMRYWGPNA